MPHKDKKISAQVNRLELFILALIMTSDHSLDTPFKLMNNILPSVGR